MNLSFSATYAPKMTPLLCPCATNRRFERKGISGDNRAMGEASCAISHKCLHLCESVICEGTPPQRHQNYGVAVVLTSL